ncbi:class I SAM-dependent methyltransferase [candidate division WOR-3 bacterium]|nr:class I SAM-dependent methyltransferase [candidate division WOR-3 bacterium]
MSSYYKDKLSADWLKRCYEIATPRVRQYLEAEIGHVLEKINVGDTVLELGCGYGRVLSRLMHKAGLVIGIDTALNSLFFGWEMLGSISNCLLFNMDAVQLGFHDRIFDLVLCIQNGISAFHVDHRDLMRESIRVTKHGGTVLFSTYSNKFWKHRLEWFQLQSNAGLLGEYDKEKTHDGVIVCKDGFTAITVQPEQFLSLTEEFDVDAKIIEVDESSLFCEIIPH